MGLALPPPLRLFICVPPVSSDCNFIYGSSHRQLPVPPKSNLLAQVDRENQHCTSYIMPPLPKATKTAAEILGPEIEINYNQSSVCLAPRESEEPDFKTLLTFGALNVDLRGSVFSLPI